MEAINRRTPLRELNQNTFHNSNVVHSNSDGEILKQLKFPKVERSKPELSRKEIELSKQLALAKCIIAKQHRSITLLQKQLAFQKLHHSSLLISEQLNSFPRPASEKVINNTPKKRKLDSEEVHTDEDDNELKRFESSAHHPQTPISNRKGQRNTSNVATPHSVKRTTNINASTPPTNKTLAEKLSGLDQEMNKVKIQEAGRTSKLNEDNIKGNSTRVEVDPSNSDSKKQSFNNIEFPSTDVFHTVISRATASSLKTLAGERMKRAQNQPIIAHDKLQMYKNETDRVMSSNIMKTNEQTEDTAHHCVESFRYAESDVKAPTPLGEINYQSIAPVALTELPLLRSKLNDWRSKYSK